MAERSSVLQGTQLGVEVTPGTGVVCNKKLLGTSIQLKPTGEVELFRPFGYVVPTIAGPGKEWTEVTIEGWANYNDMPYLWSSLVAYGAPAQVAATAAYSWTHALSPTAANTIKTYTVEEGGTVRAHKAAYVLINEIELTFDRSGVKVTGSGFGQLFTDGITMTATPTEIEAHPMLGKQWSVYVDATGAGLGGTRLTRALSGKIKVGNRYKPLWVVNDQVASYVAHTENAVEITGELMLEADSTGMAYLTNLRSAQMRFVRFECLGAVIEGANVFRERIDFAALFSELPDLSDEDGTYAVKYAFTGAYDPTWAKALEINEIATLTAL